MVGSLWIFLLALPFEFYSYYNIDPKGRSTVSQPHLEGKNIECETMFNFTNFNPVVVVTLCRRDTYENTWMYYVELSVKGSHKFLGIYLTLELIIQIAFGDSINIYKPRPTSVSCLGSGRNQVLKPTSGYGSKRLGLAGWTCLMRREATSRKAGHQPWLIASVCKCNSQHAPQDL